MSQQQPENLLTTPKALNTDCDQNEDRILLDNINSKRLLFKSDVNTDKNYNQYENKNSQNQVTQIQENHKSININLNKQNMKKSQIQKSQNYRASNLGFNARTSNISESIGLKDLQNSQNIASSESDQLYKSKNTKLIMKKATEGKKSGNIFDWLSLKRRIDSLKMLLRNLELTSMIYIKQKMSCYHLMIINDRASDQQFDIKSNFIDDLVSLENLFVKLSQFFYQIFKHIPSISSTSLIVILFKIILALQLMYQIFIIPLLISFPKNEVNIFSTYHPVLRLLFTLPFIFEIILNFNMKYFEHGEQITDKVQIILTYVKKNFWFDIVGVIGTGTVQENTHLTALLFIFFIRFIKFKSMYNAIEEKFQLSLRYAVPFTLSNLFLSITVLAHVCGCIFQWIGIVLHEKGEDTWLDKTELINKPILDRYIASLYFSFITMISVGYGDITPINNTERIFVTFMTVFSCGTFAYVVNTIGALFEQIARNQAVYRQQKYEISNYMENRNIGSELQTKVFQYLEMLRVKKIQEPERGQDILEIMNPKLRESIYLNYYGRYLKTWKIFSQKFSAQFLDLLSIQCKEQVFGPGETIYYQQEHDLDFSEDGEIKYNQQSQCIFLIIKGKVQLTQDNRLKKMTRKQQSQMKTVYLDGECFGVREFFCGVPYEFTAQSKGLTTVMKIQRSQILDALKRFPKDYEAFSMVKDELTFHEPDRYIKCQPCQRYDHSLYKCPQMHYLKRKQKAIYQHMTSHVQERSQIHNRRNQRKKFSSLGKERFEIKQQLKLIRVNLLIKYRKQAIYDEKEKQKQENTKIEQTLNMPNLFSNQNSDSEIDLSESLGIPRQQFNESFTFKKSVAKRSQTRFLTQDETELIENSQEGSDEIFYFKCPMISWDDEKKTYILNSDTDELEGNNAIQQYIEQNFYLFFSQSEQQQINIQQQNVLMKLMSDLNDNIPINEETNMIFNNTFNNLVTNQANNQGDLSLASLDSNGQLTPQLIKKKSPARASINKFQPLPDIVEEDVLIQISDQSLSFDDLDENAQKQHRMQFDIKYFQKNTHSSNDTLKLQTELLNQINNGSQTNNILNQVGEILEAQNNITHTENQQETQKKNGRTSKHFQTFKQLKTLLSLSIDKQKTPKSRYNQIESDPFGLEEQKNILKSPTRLSNFGLFGTENEADLKKRNMEINKEQENINTQLNEKSQKQQRQNSRRSTAQPTFTSELRLGNLQHDRQKISNKSDNSSHISSNQSKQTSLQQLQQSLQIHGLNGSDLQNTNKSNNQNIIQLPKNEQNTFNGYPFVDQTNKIVEMLSFIFQFDKAHNFQKYFPKGNMIHVMNRYIKYQDQFTFKYMNNQIINQRTGKIIPRTPKGRTQKGVKKETSQFSKKQ